MKFGIFSVVDHYPKELSRSLGQFYQELLKQIVSAESLGFDSFWVAEHHFHEYGAIPRPALWLAAAAQRTRTITLGSAVVNLTLDHPLRIAEDFIMLDMLSQGRVSLGVGSGYLQHEFDGFNLTLENKRARFDESLAIFKKAWSGKPFSHEGAFWQVQDLALNVQPVQKEAPFYIAVLRNEAAHFVGLQGHSMMMIPYATTEAFSELSDTVTAFKKAYASTGKDPERVRIPFGLHVFCAETREEAYRIGREAMDRYVRTRLYAKQRTFETLVEKDLIAFGTPEDVIRVAKRYQETGLTDFLAITNFGGLSHEHVISSMELLSKEVLPAFS